jgi:hypothetical protein
MKDPSWGNVLLMKYNKKPKLNGLMSLITSFRHSIGEGDEKTQTYGRMISYVNGSNNLRVEIT